MSDGELSSSLPSQASLWRDLYLQGAALTLPSLQPGHWSRPRLNSRAWPHWSRPTDAHARPGVHGIVMCDDWDCRRQAAHWRTGNRILPRTAAFVCRGSLTVCVRVLCNQAWPARVQWFGGDIRLRKCILSLALPCSLGCPYTPQSQPIRGLSSLVSALARARTVRLA